MRDTTLIQLRREIAAGKSLTIRDSLALIDSARDANRAALRSVSPVASFHDLMEARVDHKPHGPQWQIAWLGHSGRLYPITAPLALIHEHEPSGYCPLYMDADE